MRKKRFSFPALSLGSSDLAALWTSRQMRIAVLGVIALPLVYSFIYLKAFFDPYENMKQLPVAVVNEDHSVMKDGENIHVGKEMVEKLKEDSKLKWEFVTRKQMQEGFDKGYFFLGVVMPSDLSQAAISVDSPEPLKGKLQYYVDESQSYIGGRMGQSMIREVEKGLNQKLTQVYVEKIFDQIQDSTDKLAEAADGANRLADGASKAKKGSKQLKTGLNQLTQNLSKAHEGTEKMATGAGQMSSEVSKAVPDVKKVQNTVHEVNGKIQKLLQYSLPMTPVLNELQKRIGDIESDLNQMGDQQQQSQQLIQDLIKQHPELASDPNMIKLKENIAVASNTQVQIKSQQSQIYGLLDGIKKELQQIDQYKKQLANRAQEITDQTDEAVNKFLELNAGLKLLSIKLNELENGLAALTSGSVKAENGANQLYQGLSKISKGAGELANGLDDGVKDAKESLKGADKKDDVISDPVDVKENSLHPVPNYATGLAPYFISLALWVGAMFLFTVVDLYGVLNKPSGEPLSLTSGMVIGAFQAVICTAVLTLVLGIEAELPVWLYLFTIVMSFTFMAINQMLVALFKNPGRFLSIVLLMLQLTSSGGTYPVPLLPEFFQSLHNYLPMTYSVHGLRAVISNGNMDYVIQDLWILTAYMIGSLIITTLYLKWLKPVLKKGWATFRKTKIAA